MRALTAAKDKLRATEKPQKSSPRHCMEQAAQFLAIDFEFSEEELTNMFVSGRLGKMTRKQNVNVVKTLRREVLDQDAGDGNEGEDEQIVVNDEDDSGAVVSDDGVVQVSSKKKKELRMCTATLAQLLRPDMRAQQPRIEHLLEDKQADLSNFMDELSIATLKTTLEQQGYSTAYNTPFD
ncbi:hypothetical protein BGZ65_005635 [Modicella reniformis]|uniref:Uncharacterized protein n=1 Tax=Modicella reniformis TaxID=1440133 RepID=A0A9P6JNS6_9FUNG|nr:hypothetical protein BGZ65_005635 [Modicella reniformis]